jgi:hypothetical protein
MTLAGDADRSRAIVTLRDATVEGRLTLDEFADRVERAEFARTFSELEAVVEDLPTAGSADAPVKHSAGRRPPGRCRGGRSRACRTGPHERQRARNRPRAQGSRDLCR